MRLLMVSPEHFDVRYAINAHMRDADGKLHAVDRARAAAQWQALRALYERLGALVHVVPGDPRYPDMVFCANQTYPFVDAHGRRRALLSRMRAPERRGEVELLRDAIAALGWEPCTIDRGFLEGAGDLVHDRSADRVFAGHGFRTDADVLDDVEKLVGPLVRLRLVDERFYHLDTCLAILGARRACFVPSAFDDDGVRALREAFDDLVAIDEADATERFACNLFCLDGKNVVLQAGSARLVAELERLGLVVHEVETSEFIKAGGSVFCMKQVLP
jgi:N-dimethylarginine dimethylaminohydrolase